LNDLSEYQKLRHIIKTGDIIEFAANSIVGRLIRAKTKQVVNHTATALWMQPISSCSVSDHVPDPVLRLYIGEAIANGYHLTYLSSILENYNGHVNWSILKNVDEPKRNEVARRAFALEGRPYDYPSLIANLFRRVPVDDSKPYCSEANQIALIKSGLLSETYNDGCGIRPGEFQLTGLYEQPTWLI
jgi:hypothetical protein